MTAIAVLRASRKPVNTRAVSCRMVSHKMAAYTNPPQIFVNQTRYRFRNATVRAGIAVSFLPRHW